MHSSAPRLDRSAGLLRDLGARPGAIFGRLSDREAYAMILERNTALFLSLVEDLAAALERERPAMIVVAAAEGYNPVHDLCRLVAGAAIAMAGIDVELYEYAVVNHPAATDAAVVIDLDASVGFPRAFCFSGSPSCEGASKMRSTVAFFTWRLSAANVCGLYASTISKDGKYHTRGTERVIRSATASYATFCGTEAITQSFAGKCVLRAAMRSRTASPQVLDAIANPPPDTARKPLDHRFREVQHMASKTKRRFAVTRSGVAKLPIGRR